MSKVLEMNIFQIILSEITESVGVGSILGGASNRGLVSGLAEELSLTGVAVWYIIIAKGISVKLLHAEEDRQCVM